MALFVVLLLDLVLGSNHQLSVSLSSIWQSHKEWMKKTTSTLQLIQLQFIVENQQVFILRTSKVIYKERENGYKKGKESNLHT